MPFANSLSFYQYNHLIDGNCYLCFTVEDHVAKKAASKQQSQN